MKGSWGQLLRGSFFALMFLGSLFITLGSLVYFDGDRLAPFVIERLPVPYEQLWLTSLKIHVASALVAFPLCLLLMTRWLQRRRHWHRWLGRFTGICLVGLLVPSGVVLSLEAKGGAPVTAGFLLSAAIVVAGVIFGVSSARRGQVSAHAHAMRHVVAQMSVAVTSRALLIAFEAAEVHPERAYVLALWIPVLASALLAEWSSGTFKLSLLPFLNPISRSHS